MNHCQKCDKKAEQIFFWPQFGTPKPEITLCFTCACKVFLELCIENKKLKEKVQSIMVINPKRRPEHNPSVNEEDCPACIKEMTDHK